MSTPTLTDHDAITEVLQHYINGARTGRGDDMKPAFHRNATIFGYIGPDLFAGPIDRLFSWNDDNGPATNLRAQVTSIDVVGTVATARVQLENWTGYHFTDLFTLLKVGDEWKIMNKVFHLHAPDIDA